MGVALEFLVQAGKVRGGLTAFVGVPYIGAEQGFFQAAIVPAFRQRPSDSRRLRAFQVLINCAVPDRAAAGDLPLPQS